MRCVDMQRNIKILMLLNYYSDRFL